MNSRHLRRFFHQSEHFGLNRKQPYHLVARMHKRSLCKLNGERASASTYISDEAVMVRECARRITNWTHFRWCSAAREMVSSKSTAGGGMKKTKRRYPNRETGENYLEHCVKPVPARIYGSPDSRKERGDEVVFSPQKNYVACQCLTLCVVCTFRQRQQ